MSRPGSLLRVAVIFWMAMGAATLSGSVQAGSKLVLAPTRVVFAPGQRTAVIHLANQGDAPATLRVSLVDKRMLESGMIVNIDSPREGERFASRMIRYSPRRVVVPPGSSQPVRLLLRAPKGRTADGEYRSHLVFRSVPNLPPASSTETEEEVITIRARAIIETSIPVIYRHGELGASVRFSEAHTRLDAAPGATPTLVVRLDRTGDRSVYGDLEVNYTAPGGSVHQLAYMGGLAVYVPTPHRFINVGLRLPDGVRLNSGKLHVSYRERAGQEGAAYAEITVPLN